jgi:demethylmenaquinone methyltransferase/2-methoxy-6-polyprenyl-1,4-benzoquinol methylase
MPPAAGHTLTPRNLEIRDNFDAIAKRYDLTNRVISCGIDRHWRKVAVRRMAALPPGSTVLDLACGTGDMALELRRQNPALNVVGVDLSRTMLGLAANKVAAGMGQAGAGQAAVGQADAAGSVRLVNAPAEALPFPDASFAGAMIAFGIRNVPEFRAGLREMLRVLRPGGLVLILEFSTPPSKLLWRLYNYYFFHVLPRIGGLITGRETAYRYLTHSVAGFPGAAEFARAMEEAGFSAVSWRALQGGIVCIHTGVRSGGSPGMSGGRA